MSQVIVPPVDGVGVNSEIRVGLDVVRDIIRIAATVDCSTGLTLRMYQEAGGRFSAAAIFKRASWKALCAAAGVHSGIRGPTPARRAEINRERKSKRVIADFEALRPQVIQDISRVAGTIDCARGLSFRSYADAGGRFSIGTIYKLGRWQALCDAAGVRAGIVGGQKKRHRQWSKTETRLTFGEVDAALDAALGLRKRASGGVTAMGWNRHGHKKRQIARCKVAEPTRSDIIADIRAMASIQGLTSPEELDWNTYRSNGGLFSINQTAAMGGFIALRRAAAEGED